MHPQKALLVPLVTEFPEATPDVAELPLHVTSVRLIAKVRNFSELLSRTAIERLWCFEIDARRFQTVSGCLGLTQLFIDTLRVEDLSGFMRLKNLRSLSIDSAPKINSLDRLADLHWLKAIGLVNLRRVKSLEPLSRLNELQALAVAGGMWTDMKVDSLAPLASLKQLRFLTLRVKSADDSLEPLHELNALEELECAGNYYPVEEYAKLAAALPDAECVWFKGGMPLSDVRCKKCGQFDMVLLTGKGTPTLCRSCDEKRFRKYVEAFQAIAGRR